MKKTLPSNAALLPDNAECAYRGRIFEVYTWPQTMFDDSTKTFEMLKRPDTVQVIVARGNQILLVLDEQPGHPPTLHFPGGRTEENDDSWEAAAKRELGEEAGLACANWKLIDVQQPIIKIEWFVPIFVATDITDRDEQKLDKDGEKISLQWHDFDEVRQRVLSGEQQMMQYLIPFFNRVKTLEQLLALPEFEGVSVDR